MSQRFSNYLLLTRIHRPIGIGLLFLPCLFGLALSLKRVSLELNQIVWLVILFAVGSVVMRSAGCVINDLFDQDFDSQVQRTKDRPLAAKKVSQFEAIALVMVLLICGLLVLLQFNQATILSGLFALGLAIVYPLMKRITYYPQIFLGIAFNFGILMSGLAVLGYIDLSFVILYIAAIIWTLIYDSIYAYQDIEDDLKIGVKSATIRFGKEPKTILLSLTGLMFIALLYLGVRELFGAGFYVSNLGAFMWLSKKIMDCDFKDAKNCLHVFKANFLIGALILIGLILG